MTSELPMRNQGLVNLDRLLTSAELRHQAAQEAADAARRPDPPEFTEIDRARARVHAQRFATWTTRGRVRLMPA